MSNTIVAKFGGSSVADSGQIERVRSIVAQEDRRRFVVVSAPGRSHPDEEKVTDHLLNVASEGAHFHEQRRRITAKDSREAVLQKFWTIIDGLGIKDPNILKSLEEDLETDLTGDMKTAFLASRGEHYNARLIAAYFDEKGMNARVCLPEQIGFVVSGEYLDARITEESYARIAALDTNDQINVVPGFYGITDDGEIAVFSRGGSDLTGGDVAYAINADVYENWTDVTGVLEADPKIIEEARAIPRLTFKEIRLLSSKGFNVFHLDAMLKCRRRKIPINIRNTNHPEEPGTLILNERVPEEGVVGIARLDNMAYVYLEKDALSEELGFTADLLGIFRNYAIKTYHYPTDKDEIAVLVDQNDLKGTINDLRRDIEKDLKPDLVDVIYNLAIITPVGLGLKRNSRPIVDAINALGEARIRIEMIGQSPSQLCFHIGVNQAVADDALRILYRNLIPTR